MTKTTITVLVASIIGFIDSTYLAIVKLFDTPIYCTPGLGDCATVQNTQWSTLWGIPIAILGALAYLSLIICVIFKNRNRLIKKYAQYLVFGISFFGFLYSLYLTYLEAFVIRTFCQWCILSAICMTVIFIVTIFQLKSNTLNN
jgi:uncharacterized membrane protein